MVVRSDSMYTVSYQTTCGDNTYITNTITDTWTDKDGTIRLEERIDVCGVEGGVEGGCQITITVTNQAGQQFVVTVNLNQSCAPCEQGRSTRNAITHTVEPPISE